MVVVVVVVMMGTLLLTVGFAYTWIIYIVPSGIINTQNCIRIWNGAYAKQVPEIFILSLQSQILLLSSLDVMASFHEKNECLEWPTDEYPFK